MENISYRLVIQIAGEDIDWLEKTEDKLLDLLEPIHEIDGHDIGSNKSNIYIATNAPQEAFEKSKKAFSALELKQIKAAFRENSSEEYFVIWPVDSAGEFQI
jgi:hypothetical protein